MSFKFTDREKRDWNIVLTLGLVESINVDTCILLTDLGGTTLKEDEQNPLEKLMSDDFLLCEVIYHAVKDQHEGVSFEDFKNAMDAQSSGNAETAFWEALTDFFRLRRREYGVKILEQREKLMELMTLEVEQEMEKAIQEQTMNTATGSADTLDSTQDHFQSGN